MIVMIVIRIDMTRRSCRHRQPEAESRTPGNRSP